MSKDYEIVEIFRDVVAEVGKDLTIEVNGVEVVNPDVSYLFGSGQYFKDNLDELSQGTEENSTKFPVICLFAPIVEERNDPEHYSKAKVSLVIACSSSPVWSNSQRLDYSFRRVLRPIYRRLMQVLQSDGRFDWGYKPVLKHSYSENYSYGRYGAVDERGESVSEPIDAINITNLEIKINQPQICLRK